MFYREKAYTRINWKNRPNLSTPLGAKNLNKMDATINELDNRIIEISSEVEKDRLNISLVSGELNALKEDVAQNTSQIKEISSLAEDVNGLKIVNTASGTTAYMDDASNMGLEGIDFYGESKQMPQDILFSPSVVFAPLTESGITVTPVANNGFKISGTNTSTNSSVYYDLYYSKTDMLCSETFVFDIGVPDGTIDYMYYEYLNGGGSNMRLNTSARTSTIKPNLGIVGQQIRLYIPKGKTINTTIYPTVKPVNPNPNYPQPIESKVVKRVDVLRKNFLKFSQGSTTIKGVTFTVNADKSVTVNGTPTEDAVLLLTTSTRGEVDLKRLTGKNIILSGCPKGGSSSTYRFQFWSDSKMAVDTGNGATLDLSTVPDTWNFAISIISGTTVNNLTFKPMIRLASITDGTYEPYQSQTVSLSAPIELNGIGGVRDTDKLKKFGVVVFDGSDDELWSITDTYNAGAKRVMTRVIADKIAVPIDNSTLVNIMCTQFINRTANQTYTMNDGISVQGKGSLEGYLVVYSADFNTSDISLWKAHLQSNPMTVVYELAEPIETALPQADIDAIKALHSYKPNTVVMNDADAEMDVHYVSDTKLYIDKKFRELATVIVNQ